MKLLIFVARLFFLDQRTAEKLHHAAFTAGSRERQPQRSLQRN